MNVELKNDHVKNIKRGDLFWFPFEGNILPALVIQNDIGNNFSDHTIIVKMASSENVAAKRIPTIIPITICDIVYAKSSEGHLKSAGYVLTSNIYTVKKNCLRHYIGRMKAESMPKIEEGLRISLGMPI